MPLKKYVELKVNDKVVALLEVKECTPIEFLQKQKEAQKNLSHLEGAIQIYKNEIRNLKKEVAYLKGEDE